MAQSAGAAEYTNYISQNECPGYDTKQFDRSQTIFPEKIVCQVYPLKNVHVSIIDECQKISEYLLY